MAVRSALYRVALCIALLGWTAELSAEPPANVGVAALHDAEVVWPPQTTNRWPDQLWAYEVVPQQFSKAVLSNLLALAHFTPADEIEAREYKAEKDNSARVFGSLEPARKYLIICPTLGFIRYWDPTAQANSQLETITAVPDQTEVTQLGLKILRQIGIDISQLATKPGSSELDLHWERGTLSYNDEKTRKEVILTNSFGVYFLRRVDGLNLVGIGWHGGVFISFGNQSKIVELRVSWRNLQPYRLLKCPSPEKVADWLRSGRLAIRLDQGPFPPPPLKFTVFKATFLYDDSGGDKPIDFVYPCAFMEATVAGANSTNTVWFKAPLKLSEADLRALR